MTTEEPRRKRVLEDLNTAWLGTISLLVLVALIVATTLVNSLHLGKTTYRAEFGQVAGVRAGDQVNIAGVPVGAVSSTELAGDRVVVTMKIRHGVVLGADTTAAIKLTTILGSRYIDVKPRGADALPDRRIPLAHTSVPYDLQKLLQDSTRTFEDVDAAQFAKSMEIVSAQLQGVPSILPDALTNVHNLAQIVADRRDQIGALLDSTAQVAAMLGGQRSDLAALVRQGDELIGEIVARRDSAVRLLQASTDLVTVVRDTLVDRRPQIDKLLTDLREVTAMVGDHDELLRNLFQAMPLAMRNLANATGSGPYLDFLLPGGLMVDSWMCAISGRAEQWEWPERYQYFKDCE
ncbi:MCE family protein [Mycolicibacillus trivialis]|uniref:Uncharacterized protein n=1 Tax=Mycolicibacillus trivialis TaxID=1798 RepID=A0A1X2EHA9_9MYCO|nr:MCE family protein [Mycolicibacillus trivialis]ORX02104.1 hypothetical protein AWC30_12900 [Mycolicibacillus trivialis]